MGAVAPLSVLLVALTGFAIVAVTVVRMALLERKVLVSQAAAPVSAPTVTEVVAPLILPGAAAA